MHTFSVTASDGYEIKVHGDSTLYDPEHHLLTIVRDSEPVAQFIEPYYWIRMDED